MDAVHVDDDRRRPLQALPFYLLVKLTYVFM